MCDVIVMCREGGVVIDRGRDHLTPLSAGSGGAPHAISPDFLTLQLEHGDGIRASCMVFIILLTAIHHGEKS